MENFSIYPLKYAQKSPNQGILFLKRDDVKHRPRRWLNLDECINSCRTNESIVGEIGEINPGKYLPSELATKASSYKVIVSPPGSGAYIPLHTIGSNRYLIMTTSFNVNDDKLWNYTLSMFNHYKDNLILVSSIKANKASSKKWDEGFSLHSNDFSCFCSLILTYSRFKKLQTKSLSLAERSCRPNVKMTYKNLSVLIPNENELWQYLREHGLQSV